MLSLILAMLCSSSIALIFRYSENNDLNRYAVTTCNYITASITSMVLIIIGNSEFKLYSFKSFIYEFRYIGTKTLSIEGSIWWALLIGVIGGIFFFLSFLYYQISVREFSTPIAGSYAKLGIFIPVVLSFTFFREDLKILQIFGLLLASISIFVTNIDFKSFKITQIKSKLICLMFFGGFAEFSNKTYQYYGMIEYKDYFLFIVFLTAFIISSVYTYRKNKIIRATDILVGMSVGIPNIFASYFLLVALSKINASTAFPIYSSGSIVIISILSVIIFNERFNKKDLLALLLTIIALILVNLA